MAKEKTEKVDELAPEALLNKRTAELDERETAIAEREKAVSLKEAELNGRETELKKFQEELLEKEQRVLEKKAKATKPTPKKEQVKFEFNGGTYAFTAHAPQSIRINGQVKTQEEILEDEDLLLQLVAGGSSLIEKVV